MSSSTSSARPAGSRGVGEVGVAPDAGDHGNDDDNDAGDGVHHDENDDDDDNMTMTTMMKIRVMIFLGERGMPTMSHPSARGGGRIVGHLSRHHGLFPSLNQDSERSPTCPIVNVHTSCVCI